VLFAIPKLGSSGSLKRATRKAGNRNGIGIGEMGTENGNGNDTILQRFSGFLSKIQFKFWHMCTDERVCHVCVQGLHGIVACPACKHRHNCSGTKLYRILYSII